MNTTELRTNTKEMIDELFDDFEELKVRSKQIGNDLKEEWEVEIGRLQESKDSLKDIYSRISKANEEASKELLKSFEEQRASVKIRMEHLREIYSKTLN